jgi:hypothetical protein
MEEQRENLFRNSEAVQTTKHAKYAKKNLNRNDYGRMNTDRLKALPFNQGAFSKLYQRKTFLG